MTYRVRIFLWNGEKALDYMGEEDLTAQPAIGELIEFMRDGRLLWGHVKVVAPANRDPGSAPIPAVHVTEWYPTESAAEQERQDIAQASGSSRR